MAFKIGITGVGGGVGQSIIKSLQDSEYQLITMDGELQATGLYVGSKSYLIPYAKDLNYINSLLEICQKEKINLLFPGLDAELLILAKNIEKFEAIGTKVIVSSPKVIETANDKLKTYKRLSKKGIQVPFTCALNKFEIADFIFPIIIKPKKDGARSKDVFKIDNKKQFKQIWNQLKGKRGKFIAMQFIDGDEYTCGTVNLNGVCHGVISMKRILRDGDTFKCYVEKNKVIEQYVKSIVNEIKPFGACNIQLKLKDGIPYIFEINARCSGTTAARSLAGFNEAKMIADYLLKNQVPQFEIKEISIFRYWNEIVVENSSIKKMEKNKILAKNPLKKI
jgi:carbamoyl-phosphate synthase large subunit